MRIGNYQLLCELASGGMGAVHVARQTGAAGFSRLVVVKRLHPHLANLPEFRDMVRDEAHLASRIRHPNVVPVVDVVAHEHELCLVFDYVPSVSLAALNNAALAEGRPLEPAIATRIVLDVLDGLHAAHEVRDISGQLLSIVHRDVSPQNVIVGDDGRAQLIDFGIAKAAVRFGKTKTGDLKGKLSYMSPEQLQRKEVDRRADVFAAGAVTFEALTGTQLFAADDEGAIVLSILMGEPVDLAARGFSDAVAAAVARALASSPDDRFPTARAFRDALEAAQAPASSDDVARVVARLCSRSFDERRERLRDLVKAAEVADSADGDFEGSVDPGNGAVGTGATVTGAIDTEAPLPLPRRPRIAKAAFSVLAALAIAGALTGLWVRHASTRTTQAEERSSSQHEEISLTPASEPSPNAPEALEPAAPLRSVGESPTASAAPAASRAAPARPTRPSRAPAPLRKNPYR